MTSRPASTMPSARVIPSIEQLLQRTSVAELRDRYGHASTVEALRHASTSLRRRLTASPTSSDPDGPAATVTDRESAAAWVATQAAGALERLMTPSLTPLINATGVVVHTNLGRAPLATPAIARLAEVAAGYVNLEYDLVEGTRGSRDVHAGELVTRLTGAEAATVVNNNAAATLLILTALAAGREVIVSRGELVEIGGGFRVPDILSQSGATLREVGTTNRTRPADYAAAVSERTALMLRVHPSNFRIEGFTERPELRSLVRTAHDLGIPVVEDLGSGHLGSEASEATGSGPEPTVSDSIQAGCDIVCFSGDKLLGGPQAGVIVGRRALVERIRSHPLMRALRVDKLTYAALEATLGEHARGRAGATVPVLRSLGMSVDDVAGRARRLAAAVAAMDGRLRATVVEGASTIGGGSAPGSRVPTHLVALEHAGLTPDRLEERLRRGTPPVVARIDADRVVLDPRTVMPEQDEALLAVLRTVGDDRGA